MHLDVDEADTDLKKIELNFILEAGFITYKILRKFIKHNYIQIEFQEKFKAMGLFEHGHKTGKDIIEEGIYW